MKKTIPLTVLASAALAFAACDNKTADTIKEKSDEAKEAVATKAEEAKDAAGQKIDEAKDAAKEAAPAAAAAVDTMAEKAKDATENAADATKDAAENAVDKVQDAASNAMDTAKDAMSSAAPTIRRTRNARVHHQRKNQPWLRKKPGRGRRVVGADWSARAVRPTCTLGIAIMAIFCSQEYPYRDGSVSAFYAAGNGGQIVMALPALQLVIGFMGGNYSDPALYIPQ